MYLQPSCRNHFVGLARESRTEKTDFIAKASSCFELILMVIKQRHSSQFTQQSDKVLTSLDNEEKTN